MFALLNWAIALSDVRTLFLTIRSSLYTHFLSLRKSKITHRFWAFAQFIRAMCPALVLIQFGVGCDVHVQQMHKKTKIIFYSSSYVLHVLEFASNNLLSISFLIYEIVYIRLNESSGRSLFLLTKYIYIFYFTNLRKQQRRHFKFVFSCP